MADILKFPAQPPKLDYQRVKKRRRSRENPDQLQLFPQPGACIVDFASGLSPFEQALLLDERGDPRTAELYARAIAEDDCVADAYCNLGIIQSKEGRTAQAFDSFTSSLKFDPRHSESHYNLGNLYFEASDLALAEVHYELAIGVAPSFANGYFNLALVQATKGELGAAISSLTKYQSLVLPAEARNADELLGTLKRSLAATNQSRLSS